VEFVEKMIFQNFSPRKLQFFPTFWGENFPRNFPWKKSAPVSHLEVDFFRADVEHVDQASKHGSVNKARAAGIVATNENLFSAEKKILRIPLFYLTLC
jgi:hypothetical protein